MAELEHLSPAKAKEMFLAQRKDEVAEKTHQIFNLYKKPYSIYHIGNQLFWLEMPIYLQGWGYLGKHLRLCGVSFTSYHVSR